MDEAVAKTVLKELREFRAENNKRWEENEKRWTANDEKWKFAEKRLINLEEGRQKDREDLLNVLDTMQKSISNQFIEIKEYIDAKFDRIIELQIQKEHEEFRRSLAIYEKRMNFQNSRIEVLENWKDEMENGAVFI